MSIVGSFDGIYPEFGSFNSMDPIFYMKRMDPILSKCYRSFYSSHIFSGWESVLLYGQAILNEQGRYCIHMKNMESNTCIPGRWSSQVSIPFCVIMLGYLLSTIFCGHKLMARLHLLFKTVTALQNPDAACIYAACHKFLCCPNGWPLGQ